MRLKKLFIYFLFICLLMGSAPFYLFYRFPNLPLNQHDHPVTFNLIKGSGMKTIVKQLQDQGVLTGSQGILLRAWFRIKNVEKLLKAGEYELASNITPQILLRKLVRGEMIYYTVTFSEGIRFAQAIELLDQHPAIKRTLQNQSTTEVMASLGEPNTSPEGLFFPDTYYFIRNTTDLELLKRARHTMQVRLAQAWEHRDGAIVLKTPYEGLILASIIEKESALKTEHPLISGVFQRRLEKNIRLQADPTVIYGLGLEFNGNLTQNQLKQSTPYNTYMNKGLPPTPIALPGLKAIEAAMHPDKSEALYFVAKGDGTHYFSVTLQEHNEAVQKYQKYQRSNS